MDKLEVQKRVLQNSKPLDLDKFEWDETTNTFSTKECYLTLDFNDINSCTFNTGYDCTFKTNFGCTFKTGDGCTFKTGSGCTFKTNFGCTFKTNFGCTFKTGDDCTFKTGDDCTFKTGDGCTFNTGDGCTFNTGDGCTFNTGNGCTFNTGDGCTFKTDGGCTWIIDGKKYPYPPLHFCGSKYYIEFSKLGFIRSGCIEKPLSWWGKNIVRCAEEYKYSPEQVKEYELYVQMLKLWMEVNNLTGEQKCQSQ